MIEIKNVSKEFEKNITKRKKVKFYADKNISFNAKEGEILGILGPNGAGKTTLLRMMSGIMSPTEGEIIIDNKNFKKDAISIKKKIAFLSGNTKLYKDISPYELLKMCGHYYDIDDNTLESRIKNIAKDFDLESFLHQKIAGLSTGQLQRVGLARCTIHDPSYYILDEATSGLDVILSQIVLNFVKNEKKKGKCIIYSTHYMEEAENICDRVIIINKGKIITEGTPKEILDNTKTTNLRDAFFKLIEGEENE